MWFAADAPVDTAIHDRRTLPAGTVLHGPAIVEQLDATTLLFPGDTLRVDAHGAMLIEVHP